MPKLIAYDCIPLLFIVTWIYGVIVGLLFENNLIFVFSNFAGMSLYALYFIFLKYSIDKDQLINRVLFAAFVSLTINILVSVLLNLHLYDFISTYVAPVVGDHVGGERANGQVRMLNQSQLPIFMLLAALLFRVRSKAIVGLKYRLLSRGPVAIYLLIIFSLYVVIVMAISKGNMLAVLVVFSIFSLINQTPTRFVMFSLFVFCIYFLLDYFNYTGLISIIFSHKDDGNLIRYDQFNKIVADFSFFGRGLGAVIPDFARNADYPYGFELSYVNLIHKLGVFSLPLLAAYGYSFYCALSNLWRYRKSEQGCCYAVALGGLCYLFPAIGNPILFGPGCVALHCIALYLMRPQPTAQRSYRQVTGEPMYSHETGRLHEQGLRD